MNKPTFKEQSEKIIQAYLKCEINAGDACACFVGNLLNNKGEWIDGRHSFEYGKVDPNKNMRSRAIECINQESNSLYTLQEILELEEKFMTERYTRTGNDMNREDALFNAMTSTLEMLKQIHISKGEVIEDEITLQKRELV